MSLRIRNQSDVAEFCHILLLLCPPLDVHLIQCVFSSTGALPLMRISMSVTPVPSQRCQPLKYENGAGCNGVLSLTRLHHTPYLGDVETSLPGLVLMETSPSTPAPPFLVELYTGSFGAIFSLLFCPRTLI